MSWTRVISVNLLVLIVASVLMLSVFETFLRSNPTKYHSYGWIKNNEIEKITKDCANKNGEVGVFGDSFVEYYRDTSNNITNILKAELAGVEVCNFGLSGTGLEVYLARFKYAISNTNIKKAVFYLYEGNDFFEVNKIDKIKAASSYDRVGHLVFTTLKQSAALNFIYREILKPLTSKEITFLDFLFEGCFRPSDEEIKAKLDLLRINQTDFYKKFAHNQLNVSWLQVALNCPSYFEILSNKMDDQNENHNRVLSYIKEINEISLQSGVQFSIIIIPHDYFVDNRNKLDWVNVFQFDKVDYLGATPFSSNLVNKFSFIHYASNLTGEDYLKLDGHLTPAGNLKLAKYTKNQLR